MNNTRGGFKQNSYQNKREGEVTVEGKKTNKSKIADDVGEYVDYEEVKDSE